MKTLLFLLTALLITAPAYSFPAEKIKVAHQLVTCLRADSGILGIFLQSMVEIRKITGTGNEYHNILVFVLSGAVDELYPDKTNRYVQSVIKKCKEKQ